MDDTLEINLRAPRDAALRLLIEIGIVNRAGLESAAKSDDAKAEEDRFDLYAWLVDAGAEPLMSHYEQEVFKEKVGEIVDEDVRELSFSLETAGLLAWALGLAEADAGTPIRVNGGALLAALPGPGDAVGAFLNDAKLRSLEEIAEAREIAEVWCWRIDAGIDRDMMSPAEKRELDETVLVTADEAMSAGYLHETIDGDFALNGKKVGDLDEETQDELWWITKRNAKTLNWLCGYGDSWEDAPTFIE